MTRFSRSPSTAATRSTSASRARGRPSSLPSEGLFDALYARGGVAERTDGRAWLAAMLDVEAALAHACAGRGADPRCRGEHDRRRLPGRALRPRGDRRGDRRERDAGDRDRGRAAPGRRRGRRQRTCTSARPARTSSIPRRCSSRAAHSGRCSPTPAPRWGPPLRSPRPTGRRTMAARTLLQQAQVSTFGLRAAGWLVGLDEACARLREIDATRLAVQMGGPVGTRPPAVAARVARGARAGRARRCRGARSACGPSSWRRRSACSRACWRRSPATSPCSRRARSPRCARAVGPGAEAPRRWRTSATRWRASPSSPAPRASRGSSRRCSRRWRRSTSVRPVAGRPNGARSSDLLTLVGSAAAWAADLLASLEVDVDRMREHAAGLAHELDGVASLHRPCPGGRRAMSSAVLYHEQSGPRRGARSWCSAPRSARRSRCGAPRLPALERHHRIVRFDHRGHGRSPLPPGPADDRRPRRGRARAARSPRARAGLLRRCLARAEWSECGSPRTRRSASRHSCCICSSAYLPPPEVWAARAASVREARSVGVPLGRDARTLVHARLRRRATRACWRGCETMLCECPAEGYATCCGVVERLDLRADLARIAAPTLVIAAAEDPSTPPEHSADDRRSRPGTRA